MNRIALSSARGPALLRALEREVRCDQHVRGVGSGNHRPASGHLERALGRAARDADPRGADAGGDGLGRPDGGPRRDPIGAGIYARHDTVCVVRGPCRALAEGHEGHADPDVDRPRDRGAPGVDPPDHSLGARRGPHRPGSNGDAEELVRAQRDPPSHAVRARVDPRDAHRVVGQKPDPFVSGRDRPGCAPRLDGRLQPPAVRVDARHAPVRVGRPHGTGPHGDPWRARDRQAPLLAAQAHGPRYAARLGIEPRDADRGIRDVLAPSPPDPERSFADGQVCWDALRLEPLRDLLRPRVDSRDGLALVVEHPDGPLAHGDVARRRRGVDERAHLGAYRVEGGYSVAERLRVAVVAAAGQRQDRQRTRNGEHEQTYRQDRGRAPVQRLRNERAACRRRRLEAERGGGGLDQLAAAPVAVLPVLSQRLAKHRVEPPVATKRRGLVLHVRPHRLGLGGAPERRLAGETLVEHAPERVGVGAPVDRFAADLLGRQVVERPDEPPGVGGVPAELLGDPEVGQVGVIVLVEQHVGGLHVTVHERPPVSGVEGAGHLGQDAKRPLRAQLALAVEHAPQVVALDEAHRQVELPVVLPGLVDRDHVRMVERCGEPRLAQEAGAEALVLGQLRRDQLERDGTLERQVGRPVDDAHAAAADQRLHPVAGEGRARSERCLHGLRRVRAERTIGLR